MSVPILTIETLPADCSEIVGLVYVSCCLSKSAVGDMVANVKNWTVGGHLDTYNQLIEHALDIVEERMQAKAEACEARAVIGFRLSTSHVTEGAVELIGYGTAVR